MSQAKIVETAVRSVNEEYLKERYPGTPHVPAGLKNTDKLTDRYKKRVLWVCGREYPGGEIGAVIDLSLFENFADGYLFTDKGFYATKGNLGPKPSSKKRGIPALAYVEIVSVETVKTNGRDNHLKICVDGEEYIGYAGIYAPYLCEVIKKIIHDLWGTPIRLTAYQEEQQTKAAKATPAQSKQEVSAPAAETPAEKPQEKAAPVSDDPFELAVQAMDEGRKVEALALFRLSASKGEVMALYNAGVLTAQLAKTAQDYGDALRYLKLYREKGGQDLDPEFVQALFQQYYRHTGTQALQEDRLEDAGEAFRKAIKYNCVLSKLYLATLLACHEDDPEKLQEAQTLTQDFLETEKDNEAALSLLQQIKGSQTLLNAQAAFKADDAEAALHLAKESAQLGNTQGAFLAALIISEQAKTAQDYEDGLALLAQCKDAVKDNKQLEQLQQELELGLAFFKGQELFAQEQFEQAISYLRKIAQTSFPMAMNMLARALMLSYKTRDAFDEALSWARKYQQADPGEDADTLVKNISKDLAAICILDGKQAETAQDFIKAKACYLQAWELNNSDSALHLGHMLFEQAQTAQDRQEAASWLKKYQQTHPGEEANELVREMEGALCLIEGAEAEEQKDFSAAMAAYQRAWSSFRCSKGLRNIAIMLYMQAKTEEDSLEALKWAEKYKQCAENEGADELIEELQRMRYFYAGCEANQKKHYGEAISLLRKSARMGSPNAMRLLAATLGDHAVSMNDLEEGLGWALQLEQYDPETSAKLKEAFLAKIDRWLEK